MSNKEKLEELSVIYFGTPDYKSVLLTLTTYDITVQKFKKEVERKGLTLEDD